MAAAPAAPSAGSSMRHSESLSFASGKIVDFDAKPYFAEIAKVGSQERTFITTNELDVLHTQRVLQMLPFRDENEVYGNAIFGCSGTFVCNLASWTPGIQYIAIFDLSDKVQEFWDFINKTLIQKDLTFEAARSLFCESKHRHLAKKIQDEIDLGISWLSDERRFKRIHRIFQNKGFSFTKLDLGNPLEFKSFLTAQLMKKRFPRFIYISNIAQAPLGAFFGKSDELIRDRYRNFAASLENIPEYVTVIDAVHKRIKKYFHQRVHVGSRGEHAGSRDFIQTLPSRPVYFEAIAQNSSALVRFFIERKLDPSARMLNDESDLMVAATLGHIETMQVLLEAGADVNARNSRGLSALHAAVAFGNAPAVSLLVKYRADLRVLDEAISP